MYSTGDGIIVFKVDQKFLNCVFSLVGFVIHLFEYIIRLVSYKHTRYRTTISKTSIFQDFVTVY